MAQGLPAIERLIGNASCRADNDCRVIGVGAKPCGGPAGYRAWSVLDTDEGQLNTLVTRDAEARRAEQERRGELSNCAIAPVPRVSCQPATTAGAERGRCVLQSGRRAD